MAVTWSDVSKIAPELSTVAAATQNAILADVVTQLESLQWGTTARYELASKYLCAHLATIAVRGGSGPSGLVTAERLGQMSRQYSMPAKSKDGSIYDATPYGREFFRLRRQFVVSRVLVT